MESKTKFVKKMDICSCGCGLNGPTLTVSEINNKIEIYVGYPGQGFAAQLNRRETQTLIECLSMQNWGEQI